jgi:hypothetical protein
MASNRSASTQSPLVDVVECARGAISSLAYVTQHEVREVHTLSIRNMFSRIGVEDRYRYGLAALQLVKEVQFIRGGYWLPTPVRAVPLGQNALVLAPVPTDRLQYEIPEIRRAGLSRIAPLSALPDLPTQELNQWMDQAPYEATTWGLAELSVLTDRLQPTVQRGGIEYLQVANQQKLDQGARCFSWNREPQEPLPTGRGLYLCREKTGAQSYRYSLISLVRGVVRAEAQIIGSPSRLQYAVAALLDRKVRVGIKQASGKTMLTLSAPLPRAEYRLLEAVATKNSQLREGREKVYQLDEDLSSVVLERLNFLGCAWG